MTAVLSAWRTLVPAVALLALAIFVVLDARDLSTMGAVFPTTIAAVLGLLSLVVLGQGLKPLVMGEGPGRPASAEATAEETAEEDEAPRPAQAWGRGVALVVVLVIWLALMQPLGMFLSSVLAFIALACISEDDGLTVRRIAILAVCGTAGIGLMILLMTKILQIPVPMGSLF